jgi:O-Antigen ligase
MSAAGREAPPRGTLLIPFVLACAALADRAVVGVSTGGRGALGLVSVAAPLVAAATIVRYGSRRSVGFLAHPAFVWGIAPFLVLTAVLPIFGVMFYGFPERTLLSITGATTALSFLVIGAALSPRDDQAWSRWLLLAIALQLLYATGQTMYLARASGWELFTPFHQWDLSLQRLFGELVQARGTGLYFNPNELGLWAGAAVILAWTMLPSRLRGIGVTLAVVTLLLSQSRGASVALVAALVVGAVLSVARGRAGPSTWFRAVLSFGVAGLVAAVVVLAIEPAGALVGRFGALLDVLTKGPTADPNLAGRLDYWSAVMNLNVVYPWGTWGPPEMLLGTAIDSSWYEAFAQGSVPYAATLALLLIAPLAVRNTRFGRGLVLVAVLVAVAGLTQTPLGYPVIYIFWALLGVGLQASVAARTSARAIGRDTAALGVFRVDGDGARGHASRSP